MGWEGVRKGSKPPRTARMFTHFIEQVDPALRAMSVDLGKTVTANTKENTPIDENGPHPGMLRKSVKRRALEIYNEQGKKVYETGAETDVDYGPYVENGTGMWGPKHAPYEIKPKNPGGTLHWVTASGQHVFAKKVMHPGSPGQHMFAIGVASTEYEFDRAVARGLKQFKERCEAYTDRGGTL